MGSLTISLVVLTRREHMITTSFPGFAAVVDSWRRIMYIGLPAALTNLVVPLSMGFVTRLVSAYGAAAVAGLGVATKLEMFVLMIIGALASVMIPFVGQNWGAGKQDRVRTGIRLGYWFSLLWGGVMLGVFLLAARPMARLFNNDPMVVDTTRLYLVLVAGSYGLFGIMRLACSALNAVNRPLQSAAVSVARMLLFYIPLAYAGARLFGMAGIFVGASAANALAGLAAFLWLRHELASEGGGAVESAPAETSARRVGGQGITTEK
jgi:Na+-driven multidrug efflux pump